MNNCIHVDLGECGKLKICRQARNIPTTQSPSTPITSGGIDTRVDIESDKILYTYRGPVGFFILETTLTGLEAGGCSPRIREKLVPALQEILHDDPNLPRILYIIEEKMLRA